MSSNGNIIKSIVRYGGGSGSIREVLTLLMLKLGNKDVVYYLVENFLHELVMTPTASLINLRFAFPSFQGVFTYYGGCYITRKKIQQMKPLEFRPSFYCERMMSKLAHRNDPWIKPVAEGCFKYLKGEEFKEKEQPKYEMNKLFDEYILERRIKHYYKQPPPNYSGEYYTPTTEDFMLVVYSAIHRRESHRCCSDCYDYGCDNDIDESDEIRELQNIPDEDYTDY